MFEELKPHLVELRKRLAISVGVLVVMFFIMFAFWQPILEWMMAPLETVLPPESKMVSKSIQGTFFTALKVSFFSGFIISLPIIFWQLWLFIAPGLYDNEKKMILPFVIGATTMFLIGGAFAYYIVIPFGYEFLVNFASQVVLVLPDIGEYVGFFTKLILGFGLAFELPVITFFLAVIGLVTDRTLKDFFRYALILIFLLSALLTPPDVLTQFLMAGPMIFLYGVSIYIAKMVNPYIPEDDE